jgi:hypothetical protein
MVSPQYFKIRHSPLVRKVQLMVRYEVSRASQAVWGRGRAPGNAASCQGRNKGTIIDVYRASFGVLT